MEKGAETRRSGSKTKSDLSQWGQASSALWSKIIFDLKILILFQWLNLGKFLTLAPISKNKVPNYGPEHLLFSWIVLRVVIW
jgi:hypothetical protein